MAVKYDSSDNGECLDENYHQSWCMQHGIFQNMMGKLHAFQRLNKDLSETANRKSHNRKVARIESDTTPKLLETKVIQNERNKS